MIQFLKMVPGAIYGKLTGTNWLIAEVSVDVLGL